MIEGSDSLRDGPPASKDFESDPLWRRLAAFDLDAADTRFPLSRRLAFENRWSLYFAHRVIGEYKRFCYLAVRAGHPVTPSDEVDQAWHLHLLYSESYWEAFCADVLNYPLHHGPTKGGGAEDRKFRDWYERTTSSYARIFGAPPPPDIWPAAAIRFDPRTSYQRVDTARHWLVPRPRAAVKALLGAFRGGG